MHIYRLVSSHTIEENMLRKAQKKQALDTLVIQQGDFTTDFVRRLNWRDWMNQELSKVAQGKHVDEVLLDVEDEADVAAAKQARQEMRLQEVEADFAEDNSSKDSSNAKDSSSVKDSAPVNASGQNSSGNDLADKSEKEPAADQAEINAEINDSGHVEDYMFQVMLHEIGLDAVLPLSDFQNV